MAHVEYGIWIKMPVRSRLHSRLIKTTGSEGHSRSSLLCRHSAEIKNGALS